MSKYHVAYITDENYAMPTAVSIVSLLENKLPDVEYVIHVLVDNVSDENKNKFKQINYPNCEIDIIDIDSSTYADIKEGSLRHNTYVSPTALVKFNLPNIFADIDLMLYIDGDIIINKDISELFDLNLKNYSVAAVECFYMLNGKHLKIKSKYFNSGVMLFNLNRMREENTFEKLVDYKKNGINYFMDNDAFCAVLGEQTLFLPFKYNFNAFVFETMRFENFNKKYFNGMYSDELECWEDQKIFHMQGKKKPWQLNFPFLTDMFVKYYDKSPYKDKSLQIRKSSTQIIINRIKNSNNKKEWRFPREKIAKGSKIILYCAGDVGQTFYAWNNDVEYCKIIMWVDENYQLIDNEIIKSPDEIKTCSDYDCILIATVRKNLITEKLQKIGISKGKIINI